MIIVNDKCNTCGRCVNVCPANVLAMGKEKPCVRNEKRCIMCGQCEAICPVEAFYNERMPTEEKITPIQKQFAIGADMAEQFLRSRRSCRNFKDAIVDTQTSLRLVNIGRYSQTASNSQGVSFVVVEKPQTMQKLTEYTAAFYKNSEDEMERMLYARFEGRERETIFRGAPMCIIALGAKENPLAKATAQYALTYIEQFAPSLGVATCWAGYFERYLAKEPKELRTLLGIPEDKVFGKALLYGYPVFTNYASLTRRQALVVDFV